MAKHLVNLDKTRDNLFKIKFKNELEYLEINKDDDENWVTERVEELNQIIKMFDQEKTTDSNKFDNLSDLVFQKSWDKLPIFHKTVKIKEFIEELVEDEDVRKKLTDEALKLLSSNKLTTKKSVDYDSKECKIMQISSLKSKNNNYYFS